MRRYWVEKSAIQDEETVCLEGDTYHHIVKVCRMHNGSRFEILVEGGLAYLVELQAVEKKKAFAQILQLREVAPLPRPFIHVILSVPRYPVLESVIEKCVELGVYRLALVLSDFSFIRKDDSVSPGKLERWKKILISSTQQSGRGDLMRLEPPRPLDFFLDQINQTPDARGLFAYEGEGVLSLREALSGPMRQNPRGDIWTFVGGEGGYSDREVDLFRHHGFEPISLGPQVLRVETACTALVSIIKYDLDLMR